MSNVIIINGERFNVSGNNIIVNNNTVMVDGEVIKEGLKGEVILKFEGDLANLYTQDSVAVSGDVQGNIDAGGSVNCGQVGGNIDAGGSVNCGQVGGNIYAGGSVILK